MTEDRFLHTIERRVPPDRRSNWRRATDQSRTDRERRMLDLLEELHQILAEWEADIKASEENGPLGDATFDRVLLDKERLERAVRKYAGTR